jgi:dual specificity protein kinase YAK1
VGVGVKIMRKWVTLILQGLLRAEECGVLHADLKPENIMIEENTINPENSNLRIIDFGSSCFMSKKPPFTYI